MCADGTQCRVTMRCNRTLQENDDIQSSSSPAFFDRSDGHGLATILKPKTADMADTMCAPANEVSADLFGFRTCGRCLIGWALLGSVTEAVLQVCDQVILMVLPQQHGAAS